MEFLVDFELRAPDGTPEPEVKRRVGDEAAASARLAREGHLVRLWKRPLAAGERKAVGVYRASSEAQLTELLGALPMSDWMRMTITPLETHPNDPISRRASSFQLLEPLLTPVYRLDAALGEPLDLLAASTVRGVASCR